MLEAWNAAVAIRQPLDMDTVHDIRLVPVLRTTHYQVAFVLLQVQAELSLVCCYSTALRA